jgi:hypothetical protein
MYSGFLKEGNQIFLRYRSQDAVDWLAHEVPAIGTPFLINAEVQVTEKRLTFEVAGDEYQATYRYGLLNTEVKTNEEPWPYPLKIHFQGSNARCGVSLIVRGRVLKTAVFKEIWPEKAGDVSFNNLNERDYILETKVEVAQVVDVYQLLMYWDGLVEEGKDPAEGILVASDIPASVENAINHINALADKKSNRYNLKAQVIADWVP